MDVHHYDVTKNIEKNRPAFSLGNISCCGIPGMNLSGVRSFQKSFGFALLLITFLRQDTDVCFLIYIMKQNQQELSLNRLSLSAALIPKRHPRSELHNSATSPGGMLSHFQDRTEMD